MGVPKRRLSKSKIRSRRHAHSREILAVSKCPGCGAMFRSHRVCPECGQYAKRQVLTLSKDK